MGGGEERRVRVSESERGRESKREGYFSPLQKHQEEEAEE